MRTRQSSKTAPIAAATKSDAVIEGIERGAGHGFACSDSLARSDAAGSRARLPKRVRNVAGDAGRSAELIDLPAEIITKIAANFVQGTPDAVRLAVTNNATIFSALQHRVKLDRCVVRLDALVRSGLTGDGVPYAFMSVLNQLRGLPPQSQLDLMRHVSEAMLKYAVKPQINLNEPIRIFCGLSTKFARPENFFQLSECVSQMLQAPPMRSYTATFLAGSMHRKHLEDTYKWYCNAQLEILKNKASQLARYIPDGPGSQSGIAQAYATAHGGLARSLHIIASDSGRMDTWIRFYDMTRTGDAQHHFPLLQNLAEAIGDLRLPLHRNTAFECVVDRLVQLTSVQRATLLQTLATHIGRLESRMKQLPAFDALLTIAFSEPDTEKLACMRAVISTLDQELPAQRWPIFEKLLSVIDVPTRPAVEKSTLLASLASALRRTPAEIEHPASISHLQAFDALLQAIKNLPPQLQLQPSHALVTRSGHIRNDAARQIRFGNLVDLAAGIPVEHRMPMIDALLRQASHQKPNVVSSLHAVVRLIAAQPSWEQIPLLGMLYEQIEPASSAIKYELLQAGARMGATLPPASQVALIEHGGTALMGLDEPFLDAYTETLLDAAAALPPPFNTQGLERICNRLNSTADYLQAIVGADSEATWLLVSTLLKISARLPNPHRICLLEKVVDASRGFAAEIQPHLQVMISSHFDGLPPVESAGLYNRLRGV
ncbi:MAG: hypothetical protein V4695_06965 [Pseudomonadota bacterium]